MCDLGWIDEEENQEWNDRGGYLFRQPQQISAILSNLSQCQQAYHIHNKSTLFDLITHYSPSCPPVPLSTTTEIFLLTNALKTYGDQTRRFCRSDDKLL